MKIRQLLDRQISAFVAAFGLLLGTAMPVLFPVAVSAGSVTERSITLSSSAADAAAVSYNLKMKVQTPIASNGGLIVEFCTDSPLIGQTCAHPAGMDVTAVSVAGSTTPGSVVSQDAVGKSTIAWTSTGAISSGGTIDVTFSGIHNPTAVGAYYARIVTYADATNFAGYVDADTLGTYADEGGIALVTTNNIGVTAYVAESMTFCVASNEPEFGCKGTLLSPSMTLGEDFGSGVKRLTTSDVSTGIDYAQLSTNASKGAVVNMHSSTVGCGGLIRAGDTNCDIKPQNAAGSITAGQALFGLMVGPSQDPTAGTPGTISGSLAAAAGYSSTAYFIDYKTGDTEGVTSTYGSPLFHSNNLPVSNKTMPFTFGVSAANDTPAGVYTATLNLIATGTF